MDFTDDGFSFDLSIFITQIITTLIIIAIALVASSIIMRPLKRKLLENNKVGGSIFINIVRVLIWGTAIACILSMAFGVDVAALFGALGIAGIAVSLGLKDTISNLIGGVIVSFSPTVGIGDWISLSNTTEGEIVDVDLRRTQLQDQTGNLYVVPNSTMTSTTVKKCTEFKTVDVPISLASNIADIETVAHECEHIAARVLQEHNWQFESMAPKMSITSVEVGSINTTLKLYTVRTTGDMTILHEVMPAVTQHLQKQDAKQPSGEQASKGDKMQES